MQYHMRDQDLIWGTALILTGAMEIFVEANIHTDVSESLASIKKY